MDGLGVDDVANIIGGVSGAPRKRRQILVVLSGGPECLCDIGPALSATAAAGTGNQGDTRHEQRR
jgi:hypothetical protein